MHCIDNAMNAGLIIRLSSTVEASRVDARRPLHVIELGVAAPLQ
jgi:hypothetical protein